VLPLREADLLDDVVDVGDDALNDDGVFSFLVPSNSSVRAALPRSCPSSGTTSALCLDRIFGELGQLLEVFEAEQQALFVALAELLKPLAELDELLVAGVLLDALDELDLKLLRFLLRLRVR
jgi:hypothetical protein